jgi:hypothetical protein
MYSKINVNQIPKKKSGVPPRLFENTKEWQLMKADIDRGLAPQEAAQAGLTPEDRKKYGITGRRTMARFVKKYVTERGLKYTVKAYTKDNVFYVAVINETPMVKLKAR